MTFSPFNPIKFEDMILGSYPMVFDINDHIMIECFVAPGEIVPKMELVDAVTHTVISALEWNRWVIGTIVLCYYVLKGIETGEYYFYMGKMRSGLVIITDDRKILSETVLIQYGMKSNRSRMDIVSRINNRRYFFDFRIPGGFKDKDWEFSVENEQFVSDTSDIVELSSIDITTKKLTIGSPVGVPEWVGEMINRILSCDLVYVDGIRYTRSSDTVPERVFSDNLEENFVFTQTLRQSQYIDPEFERENNLALRRAHNHLRGASGNLRKI